MKDPNKITDMQQGCVHKTASFGDLKIIKYIHSSHVVVEFMNTGCVIISKSSAIRTGKVKDPMARIVCGVGFVGIGKYSSRTDKLCYKRWSHMITRCYSEKYHAYQPTYIDCTVCSEWHNFQNFAEWFYENYPDDGNKYDLDKDLRVMRNKVYSPEYCAFVTKSVNAFTNDHGNMRGRFMIGVYSQKNGVFKATCNNSITKKIDYLGCYSSEIEAHKAWRNHKSKLATELMKIHHRNEDLSSLRLYKKSLDNYEIYADGYNK